MMSLEKEIIRSIYYYPSLYRVKNNPKLSRLHVLEHMFFTIGNGYEWNRDKGILEISDWGRPESEINLPDDFFEKDLYSFDVASSKANDFLKFLGDRFYYVKFDIFNDPLTTVVFESTEQQAQEWKFYWDSYRYSRKPETRPDKSKLEFEFVNPQVCAFDLNPYPLCEYSAVVELIEGKTNSPHIENYSFAEYPVSQEYISGCTEVVKAAKEYYNDPSRYCNDHYHPNKRAFLEYDYNEAVENGKIVEYREKLGMLDGETFQDYLQRGFDTHKQQQLDYLDRYLEKFDKP